MDKRQWQSDHDRKRKATRREKELDRKVAYLTHMPGMTFRKLVVEVMREREICSQVAERRIHTMLNDLGIRQKTVERDNGIWSSRKINLG